MQNKKIDLTGFGKETPFVVVISCLPSILYYDLIDWRTTELNFYRVLRQSCERELLKEFDIHSPL